MKTLKSIGAVLAGLIVVIALSTLTDIALENWGFMKLPFNSNPLWLMIIVVLYRNVYVAVGGFITAALAPARAMNHVIVLAAIGFVLGVVGAIVMWHEPPHWYPISLVVLGVPCTWLGGNQYISRKGVKA